MDGRWMMPPVAACWESLTNDTLGYGYLNSPRAPSWLVETSLQTSITAKTKTAPRLVKRQTDRDLAAWGRGRRKWECTRELRDVTEL